MKKYLYSMVAMLMIAATATVFTSCGGDDDDAPETTNTREYVLCIGLGGSTITGTNYPNYTAFKAAAEKAVEDTNAKVEKRFKEKTTLDPEDLSSAACKAFNEKVKLSHAADIAAAEAACLALGEALQTTADKIRPLLTDAEKERTFVLEVGVDLIYENLEYLIGGDAIYSSEGKRIVLNEK